MVRPALTYGTQCWTMYRQFEDKLTSAEMKMLRITAGVTKLDRIRSVRIRSSLHVKKPVVDKVKDDRWGWYQHVMRRPPENPVKKAMNTNIVSSIPPRRGRRKHTWVAQMEKLGQVQQPSASTRVLRPRAAANPSGRVVTRQ